MAQPMQNDKWEFKLHTPYEFTINFNNENQHKWHKDRVQLCKTKLYNIMSDNTGMSYWLRMELSMPQFGQCPKHQDHKNEMARAHYHGIIRFNTKRSLIKYLLVTYPKLVAIGRLQCNEYRSNIWPTYCMKQQYLFKHLQAELENKELELIIDQSIDQDEEP